MISLLNPLEFYSSIGLFIAILVWAAMKLEHLDQIRREIFERTRRDYGRAK